MNNITGMTQAMPVRRNWNSFIVFSIFILLAAWTIQKNVEIPGAVLYSIGGIGMALLLFKGINKPAVMAYALAAYMPFSKILAGDFGGGATALNLTNILTVLAIICWLVNSGFTNTRFYTKSSLDFWLLLFMFMGCASLIRGVFAFGSGYFEDFITPLKRWLTPMMFFFIVYNTVKDKESIKDAIAIMLIVMTVVALMAIKDYIDIGDSAGDLEESRIGGIAGQPNMLAAFFVYYMFLFAGFGLSYWKKFKYWLLIIPFILCFRGIQVTFSRGGYLAFGFASIFISFFKSKILFIGIVLILIAAVLNPVLLPKGIRYRLSSTFGGDKVMSLSEEDVIDTSSLTRIAIWKGSIQMIKEHPLFGIGYGLFPYAIPHYAPGVEAMDAHDYYILLAAEMGLPVLGVFLLVLLVMFLGAFKLYRISKDPYFKALALGMLGCLGGIIVSNFFGGRLGSEEVSSYFWILAALMFRALHIEREKVRGKIENGKSKIEKRK